jgi:hypothetical protein
VSRVIIFIVALIVAPTIVIYPAQAQAPIVAEVPAADYSFGQHITFHLRASAPAAITEVNLLFEVQGQPGTTIVPVPFESASEIHIDYAHSLVGRNVPPFATITYWWELRAENGAQQLTAKELLYYADNRYEWQSRRDEQKGITWEAFWVQGDVVFAQTALNVAIAALDDIFRDLKAPVPGFVRIFIYPSEQDLQGALNLSGYDWAGGQARPELGVILVGVPDGPWALGEMERLIPHELTHLLVYQATGRTSGRVPTWLDEGLALLNERRPDPNRQALVEQAVSQDRLFPLEALCAPFPADENAARLAYAQSASVVNYLREEYGSQVIRDLLAAYADDVSCEAGVSRVLHKSLDGLDSAWRARLTRQGQIVTALSDSAPWLALWLLTILLALPLVGAWRSGRQKTVAQGGE